jgi:hypothetical protein
VIAAELDVHQPWHFLARDRAPVKRDALNQGRRAISDAGDGYANFMAHVLLLKPIYPKGRPYDSPIAAAIPDTVGGLNFAR